VLATTVAAMTALAACAPPTPPPAELPPRVGSADVRVMTWNLLGAQADDRVFDEHAGMVARVEQLRPDVVVVQEAQADEVVALTTRTGGTAGPAYRVASYLQWACDAKPSPEGVAILVRTDLVVSDAGRTNIGDSCTDPTVIRVLVWVTVETADGPLTVYGTHLTAGGGSAAASRDTQIRRVRALIATQDAARGGDGRWVLAGDVNTAPGGSSYRLLIEGEAADGLGPLVDTAAEVSAPAGDPVACPVVAATDTAALAALWADPARVRDCGYTAGWPKDSDVVGCDLLSFCTSWEDRRDISVRERIDVVLRSADGPVSVVDGFVPNRLDDDWAAPGAEWFRLSDHLPSVADLDVSPVTVAEVAS